MSYILSEYEKGNYVLIHAYAECMNQTETVLKIEQQAREDKAPYNAIFYNRRDGKWATTNDIQAQWLKDKIDKAVSRQKEKAESGCPF